MCPLLILQSKKLSWTEKIQLICIDYVQREESHVSITRKFYLTGVIFWME